MRSVIQIRKETLRQLVTDYAWLQAIAHLGTDLEERWTREDLPSFLQDAFGIAARPCPAAYASGGSCVN